MTDEMGLIGTRSPKGIQYISLRTTSGPIPLSIQVLGGGVKTVQVWTRLPGESEWVMRWMTCDFRDSRLPSAGTSVQVEGDVGQKPYRIKECVQDEQTCITLPDGTEKWSILQHRFLLEEEEE